MVTYIYIHLMIFRVPVFFTSHKQHMNVKARKVKCSCSSFFSGSVAGACGKGCWRHWPQSISSVYATVKTISGRPFEEASNLIQLFFWKGSCGWNLSWSPSYYELQNIWKILNFGVHTYLFVEKKLPTHNMSL